MLQGEELESGSLYFATGEKLDLAQFALKESSAGERAAGAGEESAALYRAARAFIGYIQETGREKGMTGYENQL